MTGGQRAERTMSQDCMVACLVERLLAAVETGRIVIASVDDQQRILGIADVALGARHRVEDCAWELGSAVAPRAKAVVVGYHSADQESSAFAASLATALGTPVLAMVVTKHGARPRRSDVVPAKNGWLRRSSAQ